MVCKPAAFDLFVDRQDELLAKGHPARYQMLMAVDPTSWHFWVVFGPALVVGSAAATAGLIVLFLPLLSRYVMARPTTRSSHKVPTPQGGGIPIIGVTILVTALAFIMLPISEAGALAKLAAVLGAAALLAVVGAIDDIRTLKAVPRLLFQLIAAMIVIATLPHVLPKFYPLPWWLESVALVIGLVWVINLVNFMDGVDWMMVAEAVPVSAGIIVAGLLNALPIEGVVVAFALGGALLGFAPFNKPVARLFLGDVGSLPIGLLLGWWLLELAARGHLAAALLLPLYFFADATLTFIRRLFAGEQIWRAHRSHFYQRAMDHGVTVPDIVRRVFFLNLALVVLATVTIAFTNRFVTVTALLIGTTLVAWTLAAFARGKA